uniref:Uncharacterized protein n=1 Tax=Rhizophora mucronata TaxID=61149 RepID=A0A2P2QKF1_RHIMU
MLSSTKPNFNYLADRPQDPL